MGEVALPVGVGGDTDLGHLRHTVSAGFVRSQVTVFPFVIKKYL